MRRSTSSGLLALSLALPLACSASPDAASPPAGPLDTVYRGEALAVWIERAENAGPEDDVSRVVEALTLAIEDESHEGVVASADALGRLGPRARAAAPMLAAQLDHVQPWIRCACMDALAAIGSASLPSLLHAVETGPGGAPMRALVVLAQLGPAARSAVPALRRLLPEAPASLRPRIRAAIDAAMGSEGSRPAPGAASGGSTVLASASSVAAPAPSPDPGPPPAAATSRDWPQFRGPNRDGFCREKGLLSAWPEGGPKLLWKIDGLGKGYSTVSLAGGRIFTLGDRKPEGGAESQYVIAIDASSHQELWATRVGPPHSDGPRSTPTIDAGRLYALGTSGDLVCLRISDGRERWRKSLPKDLGGRMMSGWKYSESVLVDRGRVICTPGSDEAVLAALDARTGRTVWTAALKKTGEHGKEGAGYSSIVPCEIAGVRQYVQLFGRGLIGVEADSGEVLWSYDRVANTTANITMPIVRPPLVFASTCYGTGSALLKIVRDGAAFRAEEVYFLPPREFANHHGGVVLVGDHLYGGHGQNRGAPVCLELATGKVVWRAKAPARGSAAVLGFGDRLIFRYDRGEVALIDATPEGYHLRSRFTPVKGSGPAWSYPVIHAGRLYLRQNDILACYDLRAGS